MALLARFNILPPDFFNPKKATTLVEEMSCYSLPYGGLGFASHILTYYTVTILSTGHSPIRPWKKLKHSGFDLWISLIGLISGFALALFTLVRCRNHWQLLVIGIWKLSMSVFNGIVGVHTAILLRKARNKAERKRKQNAGSAAYLPLSAKDEDDSASSRRSVASGKSAVPTKTKEQPPDAETEFVWLWVFLYLPGMIAGFSGLISLVIENWKGHPKLHIITYVFGGVLGFCVLLFCLFMLDGVAEGLAAAVGLGFATFAALAALYGDWALGAMTDNLLGTPSGDSSGLYWSYFILKRLTMFSS